MKRIAMFIAVLSLMLVPSAALANSSTCQQYSAQDCTANSVAGQQATTSTTLASSSTLPFTGIDVVLLAVGGGSLLAAGLVVRRLSRGAHE